MDASVSLIVAPHSSTGVESFRVLYTNVFIYSHKHETNMSRHIWIMYFGTAQGTTLTFVFIQYCLWCERDIISKKISSSSNPNPTLETDFLAQDSNQEGLFKLYYTIKHSFLIMLTI